MAWQYFGAHMIKHYPDELQRMQKISEMNIPPENVRKYFSVRRTRRNHSEYAMDTLVDEGNMLFLALREIKDDISNLKRSISLLK
jgi:hypothetical protein